MPQELDEASNVQNEQYSDFLLHIVLCYSLIYKSLVYKICIVCKNMHLFVVIIAYIYIYIFFSHLSQCFAEEQTISSFSGEEGLSQQSLKAQKIVCLLTLALHLRTPSTSVQTGLSLLISDFPGNIFQDFVSFRRPQALLGPCTECSLI